MWNSLRRFTSNASLLLKKTQFPPRPKINENDITEVFIKGGGKGGQKINKTNSKVQLKHIPTGIVVESQFSRSREDNRKRARQLLALKIDELENGEQSRSFIVAQHNIQKARKKKQEARRRQRRREEAKAKSDSEAAPSATPMTETNTDQTTHSATSVTEKDI